MRKIWGTANTVQVLVAGKVVGSVIAQADDPGYHDFSGTFSVPTASSIEFAIAGTNVSGDATAFIASFDITWTDSPDQKRLSIATQLGGTFDIQNQVFAVPAGNLGPLQTQLTASGVMIVPGQTGK